MATEFITIVTIKYITITICIALHVFFPWWCRYFHSSHNILWLVDEVKGVSYFKVAGVKLMTPPAHLYMCMCVREYMFGHVRVCVHEWLWRCTNWYHESCQIIVNNFIGKTVKTLVGNGGIFFFLMCSLIIDRQAVWGSIDWMHDRGILMKKKCSVAQLAETQEKVAQASTVVLKSSGQPNKL